MERVLRETLPEGYFADVPPAQTRRMRAIRSDNNRSTERRFKLALVRWGVRGWKLRPTGLAGKPDFVFPNSQVAIFIDGCFWHGCPQCRHEVRVNRSYWDLKIGRNQKRDARHSQQLESDGFQVLRFWEHELQAGLRSCIDRVKAALHDTDERHAPSGD